MRAAVLQRLRLQRPVLKRRDELSDLLAVHTARSRVSLPGSGKSSLCIPVRPAEPRAARSRSSSARRTPAHRRLTRWPSSCSRIRHRYRRLTAIIMTVMAGGPGRGKMPVRAAREGLESPIGMCVRKIAEALTGQGKRSSALVIKGVDPTSSNAAREAGSLKAVWRPRWLVCGAWSSRTLSTPWAITQPTKTRVRLAASLLGGTGSDSRRVLTCDVETSPIGSDSKCNAHLLRMVVRDLLQKSASIAKYDRIIRYCKISS